MSYYTSGNGINTYTTRKETGVDLGSYPIYHHRRGNRYPYQILCRQAIRGIRQLDD